MRFKPKSDQELGSTFPDGEYDFEVLNAVDTVSKKSGNEMIALTLKVYVGERTRTVYDYLLEALEFKLRHFCDSCGVLDKYEAGTLVAFDCIGLCGRAIICLQEGKGDYPAKMGVKDYVKRGEAGDVLMRAVDAAAEEKPKVSLADDEIPF